MYCTLSFCKVMLLSWDIPLLGWPPVWGQSCVCNPAWLLMATDMCTVPRSLPHIESAWYYIKYGLLTLNCIDWYMYENTNINRSNKGNKTWNYAKSEEFPCYEICEFGNWPVLGVNWLCICKNRMLQMGSGSLMWTSHFVCIQYIMSHKKKIALQGK